MSERRGPSDKDLLNFNGGELSPLLDSRMDVEKVSVGCRTLENMIVDTSGEVFRRPGTKLVALSNDQFVSGVPPSGPPGITVTVNRQTDSAGTELTDVKLRCLTSQTTYAITFISRAGAGCLIGFNEFTDPPNGINASDPKKKYLVKTFLQLDSFLLKIGGGGCICNSQVYKGDYSGNNHYDGPTGTFTQGAIFTTFGGGSSCLPTTFGSIQNVGNFADGYFGSVNHQPCVYVESTTVERMLSGPPCNPSCYPVSGTVYYMPEGNATETLTEEDTFANALTRAGAPTGNDVEALFATQTSDFCYTGQSSEWTNVVTDLKIGCSYTFTVTYIRGMDVITESTTFTADSTTETLHGVVPIALGTPTSPTTAVLSVT